MYCIGQIILFKEKWTLLVLPNPLQCENCKSNPSSQIPVIWHIQAIAACPAVAIPLAPLLFLSILASVKHAILPKCFSPLLPLSVLLYAFYFPNIGGLQLFYPAHNIVGSCCWLLVYRRNTHNLPLAFALTPIFLSFFNQNLSLLSPTQRGPSSSKTTAAKKSKGSSNSTVSNGTAGLIDWSWLLIFECSLHSATEIVSTSAIRCWSGEEKVGRMKAMTTSVQISHNSFFSCQCHNLLSSSIILHCLWRSACFSVSFVFPVPGWHFAVEQYSQGTNFKRVYERRNRDVWKLTGSWHIWN